MVTLASVLQVSCFHVLIGGEREYPSAQLPSIFLSGRGFSRVPGSFLTSRSLSFSLRFSDGSKQARVSSDEAARRHKRGRKPEKPLLSHSSLFTSIKHLASSISFSQVNDKLYRKRSYLYYSIRSRLNFRCSFGCGLVGSFPQQRLILSWHAADHRA